jgi:uncharacterized membrane protein YoaK (UPF0700 family)
MLITLAFCAGVVVGVVLMIAVALIAMIGHEEKETWR